MALFFKKIIYLKINFLFNQINNLSFELKSKILTKNLDIQPQNIENKKITSFSLFLCNQIMEKSALNSIKRNIKINARSY